MKRAVTLLIMLLLVGCDVLWGTESNSVPPLPSAVGVGDSSAPASTEEPLRYATAEHLDTLGYAFSVPPDIVIKDPNKPFPHSDKASTLADIYPYSDSYQIAYFDENWGELKEWMAGKYTALHPLCYYGVNLIDGESNEYAFALLQTFSNEDLSPSNTVIRFKDREGYIYTQTVEQVKPYIVYQDAQITVYNFFDFVQFPSLESQMEERWEAMEYNQYGLNYEWILKVRDYFIGEPGGIGRFIVELPKEAGFSEISSALQVRFSEAPQVTHFDKSGAQLCTLQIDIAELLELLHAQQYTYVGTWRLLFGTEEPVFFALEDGYSKISLYKDGTIQFANSQNGNAAFYKSTPCSNLYQWLFLG